MKSTKGQDPDGFTIVARKRNRKHNCEKVPEHLKVHTNIKVDVFHRSKIEVIQRDLKSSDFFFKFKEILNCALDNHDASITSNQQKTIFNDLTQRISNMSISHSEEFDIVCYGLGHFTSCLIARYQLAFLILLKDLLQSITVSIFDPVFSSEEESFLHELGLDVLSINEEAKRAINRRTIFFMPHCDLPLYNNLLWANWKEENLQNLIIIGNSFQSYTFKVPELQLKETARYVDFANQFISEVRITNNFQFTDIFNDLSVHYFQPNNLAKVTAEIWNDNSEPLY